MPRDSINSSLRYRINTPDVVQEGFDDEVIVVNLRAGAYYTLTGSGAAIWRALENTASVSEIHSYLTASFRGEAEAMRGALESLLGELQTEALIVALPAGDASPSGPVPGALPPDLPLFEAPQLTKYTDMRDLLVLDPIHDVDESGWPARRT